MNSALANQDAQEKRQTMPHPILVLGLESSCDETASAVLAHYEDGRVEIKSSVISSQNEEHAPYGGVVPEIAARAHMQKIEYLTAQALVDAGISYADLHGVAATAGPGLIGGGITGLMCAKGLALSLDIPLIAVNHLEGHALSPRLHEMCAFPYVLLLVSGGHTQLLRVDGVGEYTRLGSTVDDAVGEAFDKTAKIMNLGFPGGPALECTAQSGNAMAIKLPRPFYGKPHANFSFAGLKTAAARAYATGENGIKGKRDKDAFKADLAASFQKTVTDILCDRTAFALKEFKSTEFKSTGQTPYRFVVAGGVAANASIRKGLSDLCGQEGFSLIVPPSEFCTDNAAMIALVGAEKYRLGQLDALDVRARPRWPLDSERAQENPASGSGRKGPKS
jgi:N6-L-threonylcarbamoyladenine synthase